MANRCRQAWKLPVWGALDFVTFGDHDEDWPTVKAGAAWVERVTKATRGPWTDVYAVGRGTATTYYLVAEMQHAARARSIDR